LNPFTGALKYLPVYKKYTGNRLYYLFMFTTIVAIFEGIGITMLMPMLGLLENSGPPQNRAAIIIHKFLVFIGIQDSILAILVLIALTFILKGIFVFSEGAYRGFLQAQLLKELKSKMYTSYQKMDYQYYLQKNTGHFINIMNEQINRFVGSFINYSVTLSNMVMGVSYLAFAFFISWKLALLVFLVGAITIGLFRYINVRVQQISRQNAEEMGQLNKLVIQAIQSFKYLISTNKMKQTGGNVLDSVIKLAEYQKRIQIMQALAQSVREPLSVIFVLSILAVQVGIMGLQLAPIFVLLLLFYRSIGYFMSIQATWQTTLDLIGSVEMVNNEFIILDQNHESEGTQVISTFNNNIELREVSFRYKSDSNKILNNLSLNIRANNTIAIIGESGSGKSTLVDLITLLLKPESGSVIIDGFSGEKVNLASWRKQIGYVSQEAVMFDDTIANNISLWNKSNKDNELEKKIEEVARKANIDTFIKSQPDKYNSIIGDRGVRLSGGQRQRLFIARELYKNPNLLILDEATSSLDSNSERYIKKSIDDLKGTMTVIIIAHRLSTIRDVDYIYVLKNGRVIEQGTYNELKESPKSQFKNMIKMQKI
jgi:ABC-type multidrug transport system fused ATPase/permease subunit